MSPAFRFNLFAHPSTTLRKALRLRSGEAKRISTAIRFKEFGFVLTIQSLNTAYENVEVDFQMLEPLMLNFSKLL